MLVSKSEPLPEGTVIMADHQYAGRGQKEMTWYTEPGKNLTFSLLLKPSFLKISDQFSLNMMISMAVQKALVKWLGGGVSVKWPNDIYYGDQKLGGMLIENMLSGTTYKSAIIGIGLNVNQRVFTQQIAARAISVGQILQQDVDLIQLLAEICSHIESGYLKLKAGTYASLKADYLSNLYRFGQIARYRQSDEIFEGQITDVSAEGLLGVNRNDTTLYYNFKEIEFLNHSV